MEEVDREKYQIKGYAETPARGEKPADALVPPKKKKALGDGGLRSEGEEAESAVGIMCHKPAVPCDNSASTSARA